LLLKNIQKFPLTNYFNYFFRFICRTEPTTPTPTATEIATRPRYLYLPTYFTRQLTRLMCLWWILKSPFDTWFSLGEFMLTLLYAAWCWIHFVPERQKKTKSQWCVSPHRKVLHYVLPTCLVFLSRILFLLHFLFFASIFFFFPILFVSIDTFNHSSQ
jgi:hypothetical protein